MNNDMPMKQMIESALSKIREVVDVNTVFGDPINLPGEVSVIPFSRVSVGFASGGTEFVGKNLGDQRVIALPEELDQEKGHAYEDYAIIVKLEFHLPSSFLT